MANRRHRPLAAAGKQEKSISRCRASTWRKSWNLFYLYDTTLRDGTQGENITFSADEKIKIALRLDDIGIHYIEGGWPGSNPKDMQFFDLAKRVSFKNARLVAFGSTRKPGIRPEEDPNLKALLASETPAVTIFGKSWDLHVEKVMNNSLEENLAMIHDSVRFFKKQRPRSYL